MKKSLVLLAALLYFSMADNKCVDWNLICSELKDSCDTLRTQQDCPKTCGICKTDPKVCMDYNSDCPYMTAQCSEFWEECPMTCGICKKGSKTTVRPWAPGTAPPCKDSSPSCIQWVRNGFCTNPYYTPQQKREICAKSCGYC